MRLRLVLVGVLGGFLPARVTPIDQKVKRGEIAGFPVKLGIFKGEGQVVVEAADVAATAACERTGAGDLAYANVVCDTGDVLRLSAGAAHELHADLSRILGVAPPTEPAPVRSQAVPTSFAVDEAAYATTVDAETLYVGFGKADGARITRRAARELLGDLDHLLGFQTTATVPETGNG